MRLLRTLLTALIAVLVIPAAADASSLKLAGGVLTYTDTTSGDLNNVTIALSPDGSRITVTESGKTSRNRAITVTSDGTCTAAASAGSCAAAGVTSIAVDTDGGNDTISQQTTLPSKLTGGAGNDTITGGAGDDTFPNGAGADTVAGGGGSDTVDYSATATSVTVTLDGAPGDGAANENDNIGADVENVIGGAGNDTLTGDADDNRLVGNGGDDKLIAAGGNNSLDGGDGNDILQAGEGSDVLDGGAGNDNLQAGAGDDLLIGGTGTDQLIGGDGDDLASYADAIEAVTVTLDGKPDDGPPGENDNADVENVVGSNGDDILIGNAGGNALSGGSGNDRILGGKGVDALDGGSGDDILEALDGTKDTVVCGDGEDGVVTDRRDVRTGCDFIKYRTLAASTTRLHLSKGYVRIPVRCSPAVAQRCAGILRIASGKTTIGTLSFGLAPGRRSVAKVKVTRMGRRLIRRRKLTTASLRVADRQAILTTQTIRIAG